MNCPESMRSDANHQKSIYSEMIRFYQWIIIHKIMLWIHYRQPDRQKKDAPHIIWDASKRYVFNSISLLNQRITTKKCLFLVNKPNTRELPQFNHICCENYITAWAKKQRSLVGGKASYDDYYHRKIGVMKSSLIFYHWSGESPSFFTWIS